MDVERLVGRILDDERLTSNLEGDEGPILIEALITEVGAIASKTPSEDDARRAVDALCKKAAMIGKLVDAWRQGDATKQVNSLAQQLGLPWPPPQGTPALDVLRQLVLTSFTGSQPQTGKPSKATS